MKSLSDKELYELAKKRVESKRGFKIHLAIYLIFSAVTIFTLISNGFKWEFLVPVLGWGIGILVHFISLHSSLNSEDAIQKELRKLKR